MGPQKQRVLDLMMQGCSNKDIAEELGISVRTVKAHLHGIFLAAGVKNRASYVVKLFGTEYVDTPQLTPREKEITRLIIQGKINKQVAAEAGTTEQVIKNYLRSIYDKLGVWNRTELTLRYIKEKAQATAAGI